VSIKHLQRQHLELMQLAQEIGSLLVPEVVEAQARTVRILVARFAGKLRIHDRMETQGLYPALLADERPEVRAAASRLRNELGGLYAAFDTYERKYPDAASLERSPQTFIADTLEVFQILGRRMNRENRELYAVLG
jgi:hypothetical protein